MSERRREKMPSTHETFETAVRQFAAEGESAPEIKARVDAIMDKIGAEAAAKLYGASKAER
jgi:hypothetical protein